MVTVKKNMLLMLLMVVVVFSCGGKWAEAQDKAQTHHVVGDDRGWELASDVAKWAAGRTFVVGDFLWFAYSSGSGLDKDNVVELKTKHEFESCDLRNPIKMFTNGIDKITLQEEGIRYFASSNPDGCNRGLKLPVQIIPKSTALVQSSPSSWKTAAFAQQPTAPSASTKLSGPTFLIFAAIFLLYWYLIFIILLYFLFCLKHYSFV